MPNPDIMYDFFSKPKKKIIPSDDEIEDDLEKSGQC